MNNPLVTVFMAVYNSEKYLGNAIESILNQTYKNLEILIINDASTDSSLEIISSYNDNRIRIISNEVNKGIPYTRNIGLREAQGEYIAIMDSDDIASLDRIQTQVRYMNNNQDISVIGSNYEIFGGRFNRKINNKYYKSEDIQIKLLFSNPVPNPSAMIRRSVITQYNLKYNYNYFVAQDYDFWLQISKIGKIEIIPQHLLKYRVGHSNISRISKQKKANKRKEIIDSIHTDALYYYGFNLNREELQTYNDFFTDNPLEKFDGQFDDRIICLISKLANINNEHNIFDRTLFGKILMESSLTAISNMSTELKVKLKIYFKLSTRLNRRKRIRSSIKLILKHLYNKL